MAEAIEMYVVYFNPTDYPGEWVIRRWVIHPGGTMIPDGNLYARGATHGDVRAKLPPGLTALHRDPDDEAAIFECWI